MFQVPYKGNEEWTEGLAAAGVVKQKKAWHPWTAEGGDTCALSLTLL
jgi:hypothetical protein